RRPGHVRSRDQLMEEAHIYVDGASITTHIKRIRRKFQQVDSGFDRIESVYGAGYRWIA
ncbi:MAG: DNA-binding response regulator, partial [gamma proteobacterium symbiont of Ctena orbiculata]